MNTCAILNFGLTAVTLILVLIVFVHLQKKCGTNTVKEGFDTICVKDPDSSGWPPIACNRFDKAGCGGAKGCMQIGNNSDSVVTRDRFRTLRRKFKLSHDDAYMLMNALSDKEYATKNIDKIHGIYAKLKTKYYHTGNIIIQEFLSDYYNDLLDILGW